MDAPPFWRRPCWAVALALTFGWLAPTPARADPLVASLACRSAPAARALSRGTPLPPTSQLDDVLSVLRAADEPEPTPEPTDESEASPLGSLLLSLFIPSSYVSTASSGTKPTTDITNGSTDTKTLDDTTSSDIPNKTDNSNKADQTTKTDTTIHHAPEPASLVSCLIGLGFAGFAGLRRRRQLV